MRSPHILYKIANADGEWFHGKRNGFSWSSSHLTYLTKRAAWKKFLSMPAGTLLQIWKPVINPIPGRKRQWKRAGWRIIKEYEKIDGRQE